MDHSDIVNVETLRKPRLYSPKQLQFACGVAAYLKEHTEDFAKFVLVEPPEPR